MSDVSAHDESVYDGLLGGDSSQWAFGTDFADPLAGVDPSVPDGVDRADLAAYCLMLADDALVHSHRLSQWCSRAPELEEDIALANTALDLLGQARILLARAAVVNASLVPPVPEGSPVPAEDALAFFRDQGAYRNVRMVEVPNGDFAHSIVRLLLASTTRLAVLEELRGSRDHVLAAVAHKGVPELAYHRDHAARWFVMLAQGTEESRRRLLAGLGELWPLHDELLAPHPVTDAVAAAGVGVDPVAVRPAAEVVLDQVLAAAAVERPDLAPMVAVGGRAGRDGMHTEALGLMLAEMQSVARAHPLGRW